MSVRQMLTSLLALLLFAGSSLGLAAQSTMDADLRAQVAAMTLTAEDLPTGFALVGETFLDDAGHDGQVAHYVSTYLNTDSGQQIRSYVYAFATSDQADAALAALTEEMAEATTADISFASDTVVTGVAVDNADGAVADMELATDLAAIQQVRVQAVQGGSSPVDLTLPSLVIPFDSNGGLVQVGYLSAGESEAMYGVSGSTLSSLDSTWVQTVAFGDNGAAPRVTVAVTTFGNEDDAKTVIENADRIFQTMADQEVVDDVKLDGSDNVVAYRYTSRAGQIGDQESYRVIYSIGTTVTVVDVQGAPDKEAAEAAANTLTRSQLKCQTEGVCDVPSVPGVIPAN